MAYAWVYVTVIAKPPAATAATGDRASFPTRRHATTRSRAGVHRFDFRSCTDATGAVVVDVAIAVTELDRNVNVKSASDEKGPSVLNPSEPK